MDWTEAKRADAEHTLRNWRALVKDVDAADATDLDVVAALSDDLNTHQALQVLHRLARANDGAGLKASAQLMGLLDNDMGDWVGVTTARHGDHYSIEMVENWLRSARSTAMLTKNFTEVDRLKSEAKHAGLQVRMTKDTVELIPTATFDPDRLAEIKRGDA